MSGTFVGIIVFWPFIPHICVLAIEVQYDPLQPAANNAMPYGEIPAQKNSSAQVLLRSQQTKNRKDTNREQNSLVHPGEMGSGRFRHRPCMVSDSVPQST